MTVLLYHLVFTAKYRRVVVDETVDGVLKEVFLEIEARYEIKFLEIGSDGDHVHFLVQSVPTYSVTKLVRMIKSLTAREIFRRCPQVKKQLWGGEFWIDGYFGSTVGKHGDEDMISRYVKNQGDGRVTRNYTQSISLHCFEFDTPLCAAEASPGEGACLGVVHSGLTDLMKKRLM